MASNIYGSLWTSFATLFYVRRKSTHRKRTRSKKKKLLEDTCRPICMYVCRSGCPFVYSFISDHSSESSVVPSSVSCSLDCLLRCPLNGECFYWWQHWCKENAIQYNSFSRNIRAHCSGINVRMLINKRKNKSQFVKHDRVHTKSANYIIVIIKLLLSLLFYQLLQNWSWFMWQLWYFYINLWC
jgi:hypothetical protein